MSEVLSAVLSRLEQVTKVVSAHVAEFGLLGLLGALAPEKWLVRLMGRDPRSADLRLWLLAVGVFSSLVLLFRAFRHVGELLRRKRVLSGLTRDERRLLSEYSEKETRTAAQSTYSGVAMGLVEKGVLQIPVPLTRGFDQIVAMNLTDWAWNALRSKPELLK